MSRPGARWEGVETTLPTDRPTVTLLGADGNAFAVMGACKRAAREAGWTSRDIEKLLEKMTSGDYDNLLQVAMEHFDVN